MNSFDNTSKMTKYQSQLTKMTERTVQRAYGNRKYYIEEIAKGNDYQGEQHLDMKLNRPPHNRYPEFDDYEELCRANNFYETQPEEVSSQLFCTYRSLEGCYL